MNVIQEITSQTSAGTSATAQSIGTLAEMALDLRESVAGFKLPEELRGSYSEDALTLVDTVDDDDVSVDLDGEYNAELSSLDLDSTQKA